MALTKNTNLQSVGLTTRIAGIFKASDTYFRDALLVYDVNGLLAVPGGAATDIPAGKYTGFGMTPGNEGLVAAAATALDGETEKGKIWVPFSGAAQSDVGELFYLADDETVTKTIGTNLYGMMCEAFKTGFVLLDFNNIIKAA